MYHRRLDPNSISSHHLDATAVSGRNRNSVDVAQTPGDATLFTSHIVIDTEPVYLSEEILQSNI